MKCQLTPWTTESRQYGSSLVWVTPHHCPFSVPIAALSGTGEGGRPLVCTQRPHEQDVLRQLRDRGQAIRQAGLPQEI